MIVSVRHQFVFVHIHKTAGTSVTQALEPFLGWNDLVLGGTPFGERIQDAYRAQWGLDKHSPAQRIRRVIGRRRWDRYFTFSFVRNPYARAVSFYCYLRGLTQLAQRERQRRWLAWQPRHPRHRVERWRITPAIQRSRDFSEFLSQPEFLTHFAHRTQRDALCNRRTGKLLVDFVGRCETLEADFAQVCEQLSLSDAVLPQTNASFKTRPWPEYYRSAQDRDRVWEAFQDDFEFFGYPRELPETVA